MKVRFNQNEEWQDFDETPLIEVDLRFFSKTSGYYEKTFQIREPYWSNEVIVISDDLEDQERARSLYRIESEA